MLSYNPLVSPSIVLASSSQKQKKKKKKEEITLKVTAVCFFFFFFLLFFSSLGYVCFFYLLKWSLFVLYGCNFGLFKFIYLHTSMEY